jgi:EmrB/QacA subfamily drug resistance transporter
MEEVFLATKTPPVSRRENKLRWWVLITVTFGTFLGRLDQTVVNLALPKMINAFSITVSDAAWISTAYILADAVFVPIWGKLGDVAGRKKIYLIGFIGFIVASALCAIAWNFQSMIIFRIIQGFAVAADYPTAMAIIAFTFKNNKERAQALGLWSAAFAVASVFGPLIGGPLIDNFDWRMVFIINIPLGIIGLLLAFYFIDESVGKARSASFDWWGSMALAVSLSSLMLVLDRGQTWGWGSTGSIISYFSTIIFGIIFVLIEQRTSEPIVNLNFFKNSTFTSTLMNNFIVFMGMTGSIFLIPIFAQTYLGYDATKTGYLFMPMAIAMMVAAAIGGRLVGKIKANYVIFASTLVAAIALGIFSGIDARMNAWDIMWPLSLLAFGMGFGMAQRTNLITLVVPANETGESSAVLALIRNIAAAFGTAVFTTILDNSINSAVIQTAIHSSLNGASSMMGEFISLIILKAQIVGYATVFRVSAIVVAIGAVGALWIKIPKERLASGELVDAD